MPGTPPVCNSNSRKGSRAVRDTGAVVVVVQKGGANVCAAESWWEFRIGRAGRVWSRVTRNPTEGSKKLADGGCGLTQNVMAVRGVQIPGRFPYNVGVGITK
jgi:hypothetical protein